MSIKKITEHYIKTKRHIETAVLGASGWELGVYNHDVASKPGVFLCIFDSATSYTLLIRVDREVFVSISSEVKACPNQFQQFRDALSGLLYDYLMGSPLNLPNNMGLSFEEALACLMSAYAGTTSTLEMGGGLKDGGHFVVINYRPTLESRKARLRPFIIGQTHEPVQADVMLQYIEMAIELDNARHPEWFG